MHSSSQDCSFCGSQSEPRWATRFFVSFVTIDSASGDAVYTLAPTTGIKVLKSLWFIARKIHNHKRISVLGLHGCHGEGNTHGALMVGG